MRVLEEERWASLPGDEVRRALSADLTQQLGAIDVYGTPHPDAVPVYRVKVNVQRFESWPGAQAVIDAVWSVRAAGSDIVLTCRTVAQERVGSGYDALVEGHRKAVGELGSAISAGVRSLGSLPHATATASAPPRPRRAKAAERRRNLRPRRCCRVPWRTRRRPPVRNNLPRPAARRARRRMLWAGDIVVRRYL